MNALMNDGLLEPKVVQDPEGVVRVTEVRSVFANVLSREPLVSYVGRGGTTVATEGRQALLVIEGSEAISDGHSLVVPPLDEVQLGILRDIVLDVSEDIAVVEPSLERYLLVPV